MTLPTMENTDDVIPQKENHTLNKDIVHNHNILAGLPAVVYACDMYGKITYCNEAAIELWQKSPVTGHDLWYSTMKLYSAEGTEIIRDNWPVAVVLKDHREVKGEFFVEKPDGTRSFMSSHAKPLFEEKVFTGVIHLLTDTTERKMLDFNIDNKENYKSLSELLERKIEERTATLRKSEERYHKMVEEVQDYAILLINKDGFILNWNKGAENIKGYSESEIIGKNFRIFYRDIDRLEKLPERLLKEAYDNGRAMNEGWRVRKDGSQFWGLVVITALHDEYNDIIGFSKVTRDLTERKLAEDQMSHYLRDIEFRNKQLEEYAYIASHDLQEPLRKIQVFAELLENNIGNTEAIKKNLDKITSSAKRMSNLIKDVLKYSQLSITDELYTRVNLNDLIDNIKEDFALLIAEKNVTLKVDNLPVIEGVSIQLHQLFSNLLSNAIKFSNTDALIEILYQGTDNAGDYPHLNQNVTYATLIVRDNGVGFEQQYGEQVFKMFKRLTNSAGTGIGLALCKKIIDNHNGHINVESRPGHGTTFTVLLPQEQNFNN